MPNPDTQSNEDKQGELIRLLNSPEFIAKAAEGSMQKRQDLIDRVDTQSDKTDELDAIVAFLCGERDLDGLWYGEDYTDKGIPKYWWRGRLRKAIAALTARENRMVAEARTDLAAEIERAVLAITGKAIFTTHRSHDDE